MNEIGKIVRETRKKLGLDQRTLALYAGVSTKFISELENGKETVQMNKVIAVLKVFDYKLSVESER